MQIDVCGATDVGQQREHNEDSFLVDNDLKLFVVADGMGGHAAGEVASSLCVRQVRATLAKNSDRLEDLSSDDAQSRDALLRLLESAVQEACQAIYHEAQRDAEKRGMGTTCSLLLVSGDRGVIAHVGDSRVYLVRQGQVHQLSEDHSLLNELVRRGKLTKDEFDASPFADYQNAVTRAVGVYESVAVDTLDFDILPGDTFLLCSDGQHQYLTDQLITETLENKSLKEITQELIALANREGGEDNITSIVVRIGTADPADERARDISHRIEVLRQMPIFCYLNYKELVRVMNITQLREHADGERILREGEAAREMFIILSGAVRLHKGDTFITRLEQGAHLGEMALVDSAPRSASATAEGDVRLLVLSRHEFFNIIRYKNKLSTKLLWSLVQVLTERLRKTTADLSGALLEATLPDFTEEILFDDDG